MITIILNCGKQNFNFGLYYVYTPAVHLSFHLMTISSCFDLTVDYKISCTYKRTMQNILEMEIVPGEIFKSAMTLNNDEQHSYSQWIMSETNDKVWGSYGEQLSNIVVYSIHIVSYTWYIILGIIINFNENLQLGMQWVKSRPVHARSCGKWFWGWKQISGHAVLLFMHHKSISYKCSKTCSGSTEQL